jgi:PAS domain S-box-containing protein
VVRNAEFLMEALDGRKIPVLVSAAPIRDAQGNIVAAINAWLDISDRKRAEEILKESETLYRTIARSIPDGGVFVLDRNLRYLIAEGSVIEKLGYTREQMEGHTIQEVFDAQTASRMEARLHRVFAGETISYQTEQNGRIYWTQSTLLDAPRGHALLITLDITDHRQTEMALSESDQRYHAIVNQATAGIVRSDLTGSYTYMNQAFCDMLGLTESSLMGKTIWQFIYEEDIEKTRRFYDRLVEKAIPYEMENRFIRRDGSAFWANVSASAIVDMVGKTQSAVFVVVDVQERKQAEEQLQQLNLHLEKRVEERTAELKSALDELLESRKRLQVLSKRLVEVQEQERHAISQELHDRVGQNLTALNLNLTIIENQLKGQESSVVNTRLTDSMNLVTEMISIVRDVMSDLRPVVLNQYGLAAALQEYTSSFKARYGLQLVFTKPDALPRTLDAALEMTVLRITQEALLNIVRHAQANHVAVSFDCEDDTLHLKIEDNGVGFEFLADATDSYGHGLMIMRERAEAVGGTLVIASAPGKGTRIEASLPIHGRNILVPKDEMK